MRLLLAAHRLLIGFAIALGAFLVPWGIWRWRAKGDRGSLALAIAAAVVVVALVLYLWRVVRRYARR